MLAPSDSAIALEDVHLTLDSAAGPVNILRGIDLTVGRGETVGIVGPSGSGKTTMLMVIAGPSPDPLPGPAFRWRAATHGHRPSLCARSAGAAGR